ncbi:MAG: glutamine--fructose-6-phosphate transaminase (isomerizing) [Deltaproteobacteria bacterium]|nr:glutamine--fructose-6-phosphate transaminase (isomerizing) [Deltaproteobacteria bacterium]
MCGIVGYTGIQNASDIIIDGLRRLEYRGYDSAGIATLNAQKKIEIRRAEGKLTKLEKILRTEPVEGCCGIGHTRWATHGRPSETNAHPHRSDGIVVVHNGIIENYLDLKNELQKSGYQFSSETDTEIIAHLIHCHYQQAGNLESAVRLALQEVRGSYAIGVICEYEPGVMISARLGSPLVVGQGEGEYFVASDIPAILRYTKEMIFLEDGEMAVFSPSGMRFTTLDGQLIEKQSKTITWTLQMAEKGGYKHFMLKEIFEQPRAVTDTLTGRIQESCSIYLEDLQLSKEIFKALNKIYIVACGTSWHAGMVAKYFFEKICRIPVEIDIASEFRYRNPIIDESTLTLLISQSGETADTLAALREAKGQGGKTLAICNVVDSTIPRESDGVIYTHAGPEIGVASTKAFTTQLIALYLLSLHAALCRGNLSAGDCARFAEELIKLPRKIESTLELDPQIQEIAKKFKDSTDFLYLGRGNQFPIALEGALKLKEISYIHAEGYPAGEMKHGPIALIDEQMPVMMIATRNDIFEKSLSNMEEVKARGGMIIALTDKPDEELDKRADAVLVVPETLDEFMPILTVVPLQLLAYHIAVLKGTDVDQPRNLAKSVTVE